MNEHQMRTLNKVINDMESEKYQGRTYEQWKNGAMPWAIDDFSEDELHELWENAMGVDDIRIGTKCTILLYSDRRAATVVSVERTKAGKVKRIGVMQNDYDGCWDTCHVRRELNGEVEYYTLRKNGRGWYEEGQETGRGSVRLGIGYWDTYIDRSF